MEENVMKPLRNWLLIYTAMATVAVLLLLIHVNSRTSYAQPERSFHARLRLMQTGHPVPDPARCTGSDVLVSLAGGGSASRLGPVSASGSHCIQDDPASTPFTAGMLVISGRRGDVFIEYEGNDVDGILNGTFRLIAGSGDYEGAFGSGVLAGTGSPEEERGVVRLTGRITILKK